MASAGLLGGLAGLGKGLAVGGEMMWKEAIQKDRDARLAELEKERDKSKAELELSTYREKKTIDQEFVDPKDRYVSIGANGLYDTQEGLVVAGKGSSGFGGYSDAEELNTKAFSMAKTMLGGDNFMPEFSEDRQARTAELSDLGQQLYLTGEYKTLAGAMQDAYKMSFSSKDTLDETPTQKDVAEGSYDPPGMDLWGMRDSASAEEVISDLKNKMDGGLIPRTRKDVSKYLSGTMSPELQRSVVDTLFPSPAVAIEEAKDAIAKGANRNLVIQRLKEMGIPTDDL
jgi:hypothetical protein